MKTTQYQRIFLLAILSFFISISALNKAIAAELLLPQQAIAEASDKLKEKMQNPEFIKDFAQITDFVESAIYPHVDFNRISALVLGKYWRDATPEERAQFNNEFRNLLVRTYSRAFVEFKDWSVRFLPLKMESDATKVVVKTEILQPGIQPIAVDYRMVLIKGKWKAYDILIEGVSLVTNYRTTFNNEIRNSGSLSAVIETLKTRNAEALSKNSLHNS
ncbi:MlaC/ttg2D family ABC transporter substrate-binding protein [Methylotuvimicrobium alcaliphilum]|uniref:Toluene tolerance family protein n=1 Tax=Methylotuvimicrobium alcaliphilum (strain DSM 19304 / NCIMB 14124 / VKM B-2133 / 20Z) TaxID=1091494 RepID=G4SV33_META2|nr:ABC transporter substrate-binding protein [Methylotuvimicrobium alcaliphilum]CCE25131.1 Toluene tolerance family protein [Methylotuvimicrobium alcaliphilum 20Z]